MFAQEILMRKDSLLDPCIDRQNDKIEQKQLGLFSYRPKFVKMDQNEPEFGPRWNEETYRSSLHTSTRNSSRNETKRNSQRCHGPQAKNFFFCY